MSIRKTRISLLLLCCIIQVCSNIGTFGSNIIQLQSQQVGANSQFSLNIDIINDDSFTAFQFDLPLGSNFSFVSNSFQLSIPRKVDHMVSVTLLPGNILRVIAFSFSNTPFSGNNGTIASFQLIAGTMPGPTTLNFVSPVIGNSNATNILSGSSGAIITIQAQNIAINPVSHNYGSIPLLQYVDQVIEIQNTGNLILHIGNITFSDTSFSIIGSNNISINNGGSANVTVRYNSEVKGNHFCTMNIFSDDPDHPQESVLLQALSFAVNELHVGNLFSFSGNNASLSCSINNMEPFTGFQFDLVFPPQVQISNISSVLSGRAMSHVSYAFLINSHHLRVLAFSITNQEFSGNDGGVITINLDVFGVGGIYDINVENVTIGDHLGENIVSAYFGGSLQIAAPDISASTQISFGEVSLTDTGQQSIIINNYGPDTLIIGQVIFTNTLFFSEVLPTSILPWQSDTATIFFYNSIAGYFQGQMRIYNNDPDENPFIVSLDATSFSPNYIVINNAVAYSQDTVEIQIGVNNYDPFVGFQFDITIPGSLTYIPTSCQLTDRAQGHVLMGSMISSNTLRVFSYSFSQSTFLGNTGSVMNLKFMIGTISPGSTVPLSLTNAILANSSAENIVENVFDGTIQIAQPPLLNAIITNVSCASMSNGAIDLSVSNGISPYQYLWSNNITTQAQTNLPPGQYSITITDYFNHSVSGTYTILSPTEIQPTYVTNHITCNGSNNGSIDLTVTGGSAPYVYHWNNNATTQDMSSLEPGTYLLTISDYNGCIKESSFSIFEPPKLSLNENITNTSCFGDNNGIIDLEVVGGVSPYSYIWSNGNTIQYLLNLQAGHYLVTISDSHLCQSTGNYFIHQPENLVLTTTINHVSNFGGNDASIVLNVVGGTSPYSINWSNGQSTQNISSLFSGSYLVTVTDAHGCISSGNYNISQPGDIVLSGITNDINCFGNNNGSIYLSASGGTFPYYYQWNNGATNQNLTGLQPGVYTVTVTDSQNSTAIGIYSIVQPSEISISTSSTNVNCFEGNNGTISTIVSGGTTPYSFLWSTGSSSQDLTNLQAGNYIISVTDNNLCTVTVGVPVNQPAPLILNIAGTNPTNFNNGSAHLTVSGGATPYTILWSNGATAENISSLGNGTYSVSITDDHACFVTSSILLNLQNELNDGLIAYYPFTNGSTNDFSGVIPPNHGTAQGNATAISDRFNTSSSAYIFDGDGDYVIVPNSQNLNPANSISMVAWVCPQDLTGAREIINKAGYYIDSDVIYFGYSLRLNDGEIRFSLGGSPYPVYTSVYVNVNEWTHIAVIYGNESYSVYKNGQLIVGPLPHSYNNFSNNIQSLRLGKHPGGNDYSGKLDEIRLYNRALTSDEVLQLYNEQPTLSLSMVKTDIGCNNGNNGSIDLTVTGGTPPFYFQWNNGATTEDLSNLSEGIYQVSVTSSNTLSATGSCTIIQPSQITTNGFPADATCKNESDGFINLSVEGGINPYSFNWSGGFTSQNISNLPAGIVNVTVTDAHNCTSTNAFTINEPAILTASSVSTLIPCHGGNTTVSVSASGGIAPYLGTGIFTTFAGDHSFTVTDANGCQAITTIPIAQPTILTASSTSTPILCNGANSTITVSAYGGTTPYTGTGNFSITAGVHSFMVVDSNGCFAETSSTITQPAPLTISDFINNVTCFGGSNGSIFLNVSGGISPYNYLWENGSTGSNLSNLSAAVYSITVADIENCSIMATFSISSPPILNISINGIEANNLDNGAADLTVIGGTSPYFFIWSNFQTTEDIESLGVGIYYVTVSDNNGCISTDNINISDGVIVQSIHFPQNWSIFSTFTIPQNASVIEVLNPISANVIIVKNSAGQIYFPGFNINQIGNIVLGQGYMAKLKHPQTLEITGVSCNPEQNPIVIPTGYSLLGYLRQVASPIDQMLNSIIQSVILVKSDEGFLYWPSFGINQIGNMWPGKGYLILSFNTTTLTYPANSCNFAKAENSVTLPKYFRVPENSGSNMTLGIPYSAFTEELKIGEIGVFDSKGWLVGSLVVEEGFIAISLWGDDELTPEKDGLSPGEGFEIRTWNAKTRLTQRFRVTEWREGCGLYEDNQVSIVEKLELVVKGSSLALLPSLPNPFVETTEIIFNMPYPGLVILEVFDLFGQKLETLVNKECEPGTQSAVWNSKAFPSGQYLVRLTSGDQLDQQVITKAK